MYIYIDTDFLKDFYMLHIHNGDLPDDVVIKSKIIGVDTKTMGLNPFRDRLCLVQLSIDQDIHLVKINHLTRSDMIGSAPVLAAILKTTRIKKVFHNAEFAVKFLMHWLGAEINMIACTKIMSKFARTYTDKHCLKDLCAELMGIELSKTMDSYWGDLAISENQLNHALMDVGYLIPLFEILNQRLFIEDRIKLADKVFDAIIPIAMTQLAGFDLNIFGH